MKLSKNGYRLTKNGAVIDGIEKEAFTSDNFLGSLMKQNGTYYYFNRKQGNQFIYLP